VALPDRTIVPLVSPFTDDTSTLSEVRFSRLLRWHLGQGPAGLLVGSEAGECLALSFSERKQLVEWTMREANGLPVYVNVSALTTASAVDLCQHASRHGARAAILAPPPAGQYTQPELEGLVQTVRRHGNLPVAYVPQAADQEPAGAHGLGEVSSLAAAEAGEFAVAKVPLAEELVLDGALVSPLAVLGVETMARLLASWADLGQRASALLAYGRSHRVGKAAASRAEIEIGPHRNPLLELDERGQSALDALLSDLAV
jgi:dihydrodipicolinate synthase/N-acetylneuraminate lyase